MALHMVRELSLDRYRGPRWFTWVTGVPILLLVVAAGITGYWLVWDRLAQYVAVVSTEWLDRLRIFGQSIARNFLSPTAWTTASSLCWCSCISSCRCCSCWCCGSICSGSAGRRSIRRAAWRLALPRHAGALAGQAGAEPGAGRPRDGPCGGRPRLVLSRLLSAPRQLARSRDLGPCRRAGPHPGRLPWLPPLKRAPVAVVDLANCNGCTRCANDCPYNAIDMMPRTDGRAFEREAVVDPALCVSCGICAGACPTSMPFRAQAAGPGHRSAESVHGELRDRVRRAAAACRQGPRIMVFGCDGRPVAGRR